MEIHCHGAHVGMVQSLGDAEKRYRGTNNGIEYVGKQTLDNHTDS